MDSSPFIYENSNLYNSRGEAVMMEWEREWMKRSAEIVCRNGGDILNIGHGLGLVDSYIQEHNPKSHTIIEVHPKVHQYMKENGWYDKAKVIESDWREVITKLTTFDGIYFDTWRGNSFDFINGLILKLPYLLNKGGIFSFWVSTDKENTYLKTLCNELGLIIEYEKFYVKIEEEQYKNSKEVYINPNLKYVLLPIITNPNKPIDFKLNIL